MSERLPVFSLLGETAFILERRREFYELCAYDLQKFFDQSLMHEALLNINTRVKSAMSLQEKIFRKRLYLQWVTPHDILNNLADLIGVRVECRFLREERVFYTLLCRKFTELCEDGMYCMPGHKEIRLNLSSAQPQLQKNGMDIYRVDGRYDKDDLTVPFEIQIKALVHSFWSEIEHQLIYKNNQYRGANGFLENLLTSSYRNLEHVDYQLQMIFDEMRKQNKPARLSNQLGKRFAVARMLSEGLLRRMKESLGFTLNCSHICDILTSYILYRFDAVQSDESYIDLYAQIREVFNRPIQFDGALEIPPIVSDDYFCKTIGNHFIRCANQDYDWYLFFRMLLILDPEEDPSQSAQRFLNIFRSRFTQPELYAAADEWPQEDRQVFIDRMLKTLAHLYTRKETIYILSEKSVRYMCVAVQEACERAADTGEINWDSIGKSLQRAMEKAVDQSITVV